MSRSIEYLNGKKYYPIEMVRLADENIKGKVVIFYKNLNYKTVYGFVFKDVTPPLPKQAKYEVLMDLIGVSKYGDITNNNVLIYESDLTKDKVRKLIYHSLTIKNYKSITKTNIISVVNEIIKKYGYEVGNYSTLVESKPSGKSKDGKYLIYSGFYPDVSGDEYDSLYSELSKLGFNDIFYNAQYHYSMIHKPTGIKVTLTEGDLDILIPVNK